MLVDIECVRKTTASRLEALEKLFSIVGKIECPGMLQDNFEYDTRNPSHACDITTLVRNMSYVSVHDEPLFQHNQPKLLKDTWIWRSDFLRVRGRVSFPYEMYSLDSVRSKIIQTKEIICSFTIGEWGLSKWNTHHDEIYNALCDAIPEIQQIYKDKLKDIEFRVAAWTAGINRALTTIPQ